MLVIGIIGTIIFGLQAIGNSESFSFLGMDVAVSTANWTPVIVSGIILIVGIIMSVSAKRA